MKKAFFISVLSAFCGVPCLLPEIIESAGTGVQVRFGKIAGFILFCGMLRRVQKNCFGEKEQLLLPPGFLPAYAYAKAAQELPQVHQLPPQL